MTTFPHGLLPIVDDENRPFWDGTSRGELLVHRCATCGRRRMPPRPMCPTCRSLDATWEPVSGRGRVWSFAVPHPPLLAAYMDAAPYVVAVIEIEEDPSIRFVGTLVGSPPADDVAIGAAVEVDFGEPVDDGDGPITFPEWRLS